MRKDIRIEKTEQCTIYICGIEKFRIVQTSDEEFIVQKFYNKTETEGFLWWQKTSSWDEWERVDKNGLSYYTVGSISNYDDFETYKTLDAAIKWIEDYAKYPIYH